jgi:hypothetical protein
MIANIFLLLMFLCVVLQVILGIIFIVYTCRLSKCEEKSEMYEEIYDRIMED